MCFGMKKDSVSSIGYYDIKEKKLHGRKFLVNCDYMVECKVNYDINRNEYFLFRKNIIRNIKNNLIKMKF